MNIFFNLIHFNTIAAKLSKNKYESKPHKDLN